ncbi:MAG: NTP transferase domain-containing protein, partial [Candidatus Hydrogenedentota bacterium]
MPKSFVCLGEKTILEESFLRLLDVGIERIVIVTGHLSEQFDPLQARYRETVELVYNPHFADSGTLYSLYCARHLVHGSFLLLEADLIYEQRALRVCLEYPSENILLLSGFSNTSDEYFVETLDGNLLNISKDRKSLGSEVRGEMVGISKISFSMYSLMLETAEERFRVTRHLGYEMDWLISVAPDIPISCPLVDDLVWCEIDDETQYAHARDTIYPVVSKLDFEREMRVRERQRGLLSKFKTVGFGAERGLMIQHVRDFFETTNRHEIRASIMFGTLL